MCRRLLAVSLFVLSLPSLLLAWGNDKKVGEFRDATPAELAMKSISFAPDAPAAVLDWLQRSDDDALRANEYVRMKIFKEEGKKYGDVEIVYMPRYLSISDLEARTIRPDGTIVPFTGKVYEKVIVKSGGVRVVSKTFSLPDVQPGCIIEYHYQTNAKNRFVPLFGTHFTVQREIPVLKTSIWMRSLPRPTSFFTYRGLPEGKKPEKVGDHFEVELTDIPAFEDEHYMPPKAELRPEISFYYTFEGLDADAFWKQQAEEWRDASDEYIARRRGIAKAAQEIVGENPPQTEETLRKLYTRVQQIRNLGYEPEKSEQEQRKLNDNLTVNDVWSNGYGWPKEINALFVGLVRAAGFEAYVVRVAPRDERFFQKKIPLAQQLDEEIATVIVGGKPLYFDPATPYTQFATLPWEKTNVMALKLLKPKRNETNDFFETPDAGIAHTTRTAVASMDDTGAVNAHVVVTFAGQDAMTRRLEHRNDDEAAVRKALTDDLKAWFPHGATVTLGKVTGLRAIEEPLVVEADLVMTDLASSVGSRTIVPLSIFRGASSNPFSSEKRKHPIYFEHPFQTTDTVTFKLPAGTTIESVPKAANVDVGAMTFETKYTKTATDVTFKRELTVTAKWVDREHYGTVRTFFGKAATADDEQLVLKSAGGAK
jgi:hypothetical protein